MGSLAGLLAGRGFTVTGSDADTYPPMSDELARLGIPVKEGFRAQNVAHRPDLVVVGNVCRANHPEAVAAREAGLHLVSMPHALHDLFLRNGKPVVIAGTHGKTTTTALTAFLLQRCGRDPSVLVGGVTADFGCGYRLGSGPHFVIEGDEYDSAYFEKIPKFLSYAPACAVITSVEHDHIDIYPTEESYMNAFVSFAELVADGPLVAFAGDAGVREVLRAARLRCDVVTYGVDGDELPDAPDWLARPGKGGAFELEVQGRSAGGFATPLIGRHNLRNTVAALALAHLGADIPLRALREALPFFGGVMRRQQFIGEVSDVRIYDDFAHHPTAVRVTLEALKEHVSPGRLIAAFEPRSATACRRLHQEAYAEAFGAADQVILAPVGRDLPAAEMLDTNQLARDLAQRGIPAQAAASHGDVLSRILSIATAGDSVVFLSNGAFGGLKTRLLDALGQRT